MKNDKVTFSEDFDQGFGFGLGFFLAGSIYLVGWILLGVFLFKSAAESLLP